MQYHRSLDIERRLMAVLRLIWSGGYPTPMLVQLGASPPTVSRDATALCGRGREIRSEWRPEAWRCGPAEKGPSSARFADFRLEKPGCDSVSHWIFGMGKGGIT
jgi:hypothetical protein